MLCSIPTSGRAEFPRLALTSSRRFHRMRAFGASRNCSTVSQLTAAPWRTHSHPVDSLWMASRFGQRIGFLAVDQPRYAEAIDHHAETRGPERLLERNHNRPILGQFVKDP